MSVALFGFWNVMGLVIAIFLLFGLSGNRSAFGMADGWEFVNPIHVHKYNHVNWFGAIVVAIIYSFICPLGTICYWCYKLSTVGRK